MLFSGRRVSLFDLQKAQIFCHKKFYSLKQTVRKILKRQWLSVAIAHYARKLNRMWKKKNKTYLKVVDLLRPRQGTKITVDYRELPNL